jgi:prophage regulatory protein
VIAPIEAHKSNEPADGARVSSPQAEFGFALPEFGFAHRNSPSSLNARSSTPSQRFKRRVSMPNQASLPATGFLRIGSVLAPRGPIPVSKSTWWAGVKAGRYPKPVKLGPRITAWRVEDIRNLIEKPEA